MTKKSSRRSTSSTDFFLLLPILMSMLLGIRIGTPSPQAKTKLPPRYLQLKCDQCGVEFERHNNVKRQQALQYHFCSKKCSQAAHGKDGVLFPAMEETMRQKFGDDFRQVISAKAQAATSVEVRKLSRERAHQTVMERYGVKTAVEIPHVRKICLEKGASTEAISKRKATNLERFGVESTLSLTEVRAKGQTPEAKRKRHQTMLDNHSFGKSKPEDRFYEHLVTMFDVVERQKRVLSWWIDFYVPSIDTYIQFDGEYWHGLDRSLEEIKKRRFKRDSMIEHAYNRDRLQDAWFAERNLRLIRVTDKQFARGDLPDELR